MCEDQKTVSNTNPASFCMQYACTPNYTLAQINLGIPKKTRTKFKYIHVIPELKNLSFIFVAINSWYAHFLPVRLNLLFFYW